MISIIIVASVLSAEPCSLSGRVSLESDGQKLDPSGLVVVYVKKVEGGPFEAAPHTHNIYQTDFQFRPAVLPLVRGDSVQFVNTDKDLHSVFSKSPPTPFELAPSREGLTGKPVQFNQLGAMRIQCDLHEDMRTDVLVLENPFFAVVQRDGAWQISNLPPGKYTLVAWEPNGGTAERGPLKSCAGPMTVKKPIAVEQLPKQRTYKLNGQVYGPYARRKTISEGQR